MNYIYSNDIKTRININISLLKDIENKIIIQNIKEKNLNITKERRKYFERLITSHLQNS